MTALRAEHAQHQREIGPTASLWPEPEDDTTLVIGHWTFVGQDFWLPPHSLYPATEPVRPGPMAEGGQPCPGSS